MRNKILTLDSRYNRTKNVIHFESDTKIVCLQRTKNLKHVLFPFLYLRFSIDLILKPLYPVCHPDTHILLLRITKFSKSDYLDLENRVTGLVKTFMYISIFGFHSQIYLSLINVCDDITFSLYLYLEIEITFVKRIRFCLLKIIRNVGDFGKI